MSLYSYLNKESIVINKLIAFTQAPKFATLMELLMKQFHIRDIARFHSIIMDHNLQESFNKQLKPMIRLFLKTLHS